MDGQHQAQLDREGTIRGRPGCLEATHITVRSDADEGDILFDSRIIYTS